MNRLNKKPVRQLGVTLVELMIAIVLGLLVVGGVVQVFVSSKSAYLTNEGLARVQETGRFLMAYLEPILQEAGRPNYCSNNYIPYVNLVDDTDADYHLSFYGLSYRVAAFDFDNTAPADATYNLGTSGGWSNHVADNVPTDVRDLALPGSDVLIVKRAVPIPRATQCGASITPGTAAIALCDVTTGNPYADDLFDQYDLMAVTDCNTGMNVFQNVSTTNASVSRGSGGNPGNQSTNWVSTFSDAPMQVYRLDSYAFFVGTGANGAPALFEMNFGRGGADATPVELIDNVENMQIMFGVDDGSDTATYLSPSDTSLDLTAIRSVSIGLLFRSDGTGAGASLDQDTYFLAGVDVKDATGSYTVRKAFNSTIAIRNLVIGI